MNSFRREIEKRKPLKLSLRSQRWIVGGGTAFFALLFLVCGYMTAGPGFPIDDAWIHQTYARNLALSGRWEFIPGQTSGGSTSPLWTIFLSLGPLIGFKTPYFWTGLLSIGLFGGTSLIGFEIIHRKTDANFFLAMTGGLLIGLEWHLLWSSSSGMETILFCFLCLSIFFVLLEDKHWIWTGLLGGLILWVRPDGITLLGPVFLLTLWKLLKKEIKRKSFLSSMLVIAILIMLYGLFNFSTIGKIFPNTLYAKQIEYAASLEQSIFLRMGKVFLVPITGAGLFLIPGFIQSIIDAYIKKDVWIASALLWFFGYGAIYAFKLPMTYQHGRYLIPLIPIFFVIGIIGSGSIYQKLIKSQSKWKYLAGILLLASGITAITFSLSGQSAFASDLITIERLMIGPAKWTKDNTPSDSMIAVHDIGAMGYFGDRKIIDLAGLIQPEIIPMIRDENAIRDYLVDQKADYLVVFHDWYPELIDFGTILIQYEIPINGKKEIVDIRRLK